MPMQNVAAILEEILNEADALIRQRLKERGLELPHLLVGAPPDDQIVERSNGDPSQFRGPMHRIVRLRRGSVVDDQLILVMSPNRYH